MNNNRQKGFTLLEILIGLALSSLVLVALGNAMRLFIFLPQQSSDKMTAIRDLEQASSWITLDANMTQTFTSLSSPQYGRFDWTDRTGASPVSYSALYYYESGQLMRQESINGVVQSTIAISRNITGPNDILFQWSPSTYALSLTITSSVQGDTSVSTTAYTGTINATLRYLAELTVSQPGDVPIYPPPPGSETYFLGVTPTILQGTLASGNLASLQSPDQNFFQVTSTGGVNKEVIWHSQSQSMSAPTTINDIEVRYTGKSSRANTSLQFFVVDPNTGDFSTAPASGFTHTVADTVETHNFFLDAPVVSYINQPSVRVVKLKIDSSANAVFDLYSDYVLFIASP